MRGIRVVDRGRAAGKNDAFVMREFGGGGRGVQDFGINSEAPYSIRKEVGELGAEVENGDGV